MRNIELINFCSPLTTITLYVSLLYRLFAGILFWSENSFYLGEFDLSSLVAIFNGSRVISRTWPFFVKPYVFSGDECYAGDM